MWLPYKNLGAGLGLKRRGDLNSQEYLLIIYLNMHLTSGWLLREKFLWDLSNPDNSPEDFARQLMLDYQQPYFGEDLNRVAFEIRKQIDSHCA